MVRGKRRCGSLRPCCYCFLGQEAMTKMSLALMFIRSLGRECWACELELAAWLAVLVADVNYAARI